MGGTCNRHGEMRNAYKILVENLKRGEDLSVMVLNSTSSGWDPVWDSYEHDNGFIPKCF
jgi:hypothetical protein